MKEPISLTNLVGQYSALAALIGFGAFVNGMLQYNRARILGKEFRLLDFFISSMVAGFAGLMFSLSAAYFTNNDLAVYWVGGMGAFAGLRGINSLVDIAIEMLARHARK